MLRGQGSRRRSRGFSLIELVVVIILIGILLVTAIERLMPYLDEAERVSVLTLESQLRNSLVMQAATFISRGEPARIAELESINPMELLLEAPDNYVGERRLGHDEIPARRWYFDPARKRLAYRLGEPYAARHSSQNWRDPEFQVRVIYQDRDADGRFDVSKDELFGVRLLRISGAEWLTSGQQY